MSHPQNIQQEVVAALLRGDKIGAVKLIREATGGDLKSAMSMVQNYLQQATEAQKQSRANANGGHGEVSDRRGAELSDHLSKGISAGHAQVEALLHKTRPPTVMPGDGATNQWVWLLVGIVAFAGWLFFR